MNARSRFTSIALVHVVACLLAWAPSMSAQASADPEGLTGTWQVIVTLHDCKTGAAIGPPFSSLLTFADGGTLTESTANPLFFPAIRGPGQGVWGHSHHKGQYIAASTAFITMNGVLVKTQKITQMIELGPKQDEFTTPQATVEFFDPAGTLLTSGCAAAVGKRFEA